jgi:hypothetical protein
VIGLGADVVDARIRHAAAIDDLHGGVDDPLMHLATAALLVIRHRIRPPPKRLRTMAPGLGKKEAINCI